MSIIRKSVAIQATETAQNRTRLVAATNKLARDGHVLEPAGMHIGNFLRSGIILFNHDAAIPVGVPVSGNLNRNGDLEIELEWPPAGVSQKADEIRGLVKSGIIRAGSVGFDPVESEPLDPSKPRAGQHITKSELLELSFVSVPADTGALVTQRSDKTADWKVGASRDLPIEDSDSWDGQAAEASIFEHAGGDDFDPAKARKGFLVYNAAEPKLRGSYKLPIAHVADGELKVPKGAIRAAASRLPQTDIPENVKESAGKVLDHYKEKAGMGKDPEDKERALKAARVRMLVAEPGKPKLRGLCEVGELAFALGHLGFVQNMSAWEAEVEKDDSPVPAMLGEALKSLGAALIAMTSEEVGELLDDLPDDGEDGGIETRDLPESERTFVLGGKTPRARAWRRGIALYRAGKTLSASNEKKLDEANGHAERAMKHHKAMGEHHAAVDDHLEGIRSAHEKLTDAHEKVGDALQQAWKNPTAPQDHIARAMRHHEAAQDQAQKMSDSLVAVTDRSEDIGDAHEAMGKSVKRCMRSIRAVVDGATPGAEDGDSKEVQTSAGTGDDAGSRDADFRRRQADALRLAGAL